MLTIPIAGGCANGEGDLTDAMVMSDAGTDATTVVDATVTRDSAVDANTPYVYDGQVPANGAVLFTETGLTGTARLVTADVLDLGAFHDDVASLIVPAGYTLYGATDPSFGGDLSEPYIGPTQVDDLAALANQWDSVIFRSSLQKTATVYRDVGTNGKVYPVGAFPSIGASSDLIDGMNLPEGITLIGYDDNDFQGTMRGPYVGPLDVGALPFRDKWSSLVIRVSTPEDPEIGDIRFYVGSNYTAEMLVLTAGQYPHLDGFPDIMSFLNKLSSVRGRNAMAVWGFETGEYGGDLSGPLVGDMSLLQDNDDWDSIVIQSINDATLTVYLDLNGGVPATPLIYPLVSVPQMGGYKNKANAVFVPDGYVVFAYADGIYGGTTWMYGAGTSIFPGNIDDDWDSFALRRTTDPTVTIYFGNGRTDARVYPLLSVPNMANANDNNDGVLIPCGVQVRGFQNENYGGTAYATIVGPADLETVGAGDGAWSSMIIERSNTVCP